MGCRYETSQAYLPGAAAFVTLVLPFSSSRRLDLVLLSVMIGGYLANVFLPTSWILH